MKPADMEALALSIDAQAATRSAAGRSIGLDLADLAAALREGATLARFLDPDPDGDPDGEVD